MLPAHHIGTDRSNYICLVPSSMMDDGLPKAIQNEIEMIYLIDLIHLIDHPSTPGVLKQIILTWY